MTSPDPYLGLRNGLVAGNVAAFLGAGFPGWYTSTVARIFMVVLSNLEFTKYE
jgi:hypothetical protein